jgi:hypothetical protein
MAAWSRDHSLVDTFFATLLHGSEVVGHRSTTPRCSHEVQLSRRAVSPGKTRLRLAIRDDGDVRNDAARPRDRTCRG